jgi:hypothetical protein
MTLNFVSYDEFGMFREDDNETSLSEEVWQDELRRRRVSRRPRQPQGRFSPSRQRVRPGRRRRRLMNSVRPRPKSTPPRRKQPKPVRPRRPPSVLVNVRSFSPYAPSEPPMDDQTEPSAPPLEKASEFVRWVQSTLNLVMQLSLPVDGIMSPATRSAIRTFQEREGLIVDGIVGPDTQAALAAARQKGNGTSLTADKKADAPQEEYFLGAIWNKFGKPEGQVDRQSHSYIRWVQQALNKIMGQKLTVDGISGPKTRSAVRDFQRQQGLTVDGIVGPNTEAALVAAGAGRPPQTQVPNGGAAGGSGYATPSTQALRNKIVQIAKQEWERWGRGKTKEEEPRMRSVLEGYWRKGAGWLPTQAAWWSTVPWSAAFISWVMRQAGAGNAFRYSGSHAEYVAAARDNRLANNSNPFKAYRTSEVAPQPGDLVCKRRENGVTYDNVRRGHLTHCDVVTAVQGNKLITIGGNVSDSVKVTEVVVDENGRVTDPSYFAVVKVGSAKP